MAYDFTVIYNNKYDEKKLEYAQALEAYVQLKMQQRPVPIRILVEEFKKLHPSKRQKFLREANKNPKLKKLVNKHAVELEIKNKLESLRQQEYIFKKSLKLIKFKLKPKYVSHQLKVSLFNVQSIMSKILAILNSNNELNNNDLKKIDGLELQLKYEIDKIKNEVLKADVKQKNELKEPSIFKDEFDEPKLESKLELEPDFNPFDEIDINNELDNKLKHRPDDNRIKQKLDKEEQEQAPQKDLKNVDESKLTILKVLSLELVNKLKAKLTAKDLQNLENQIGSSADIDQYRTNKDLFEKSREVLGRGLTDSAMKQDIASTSYGESIERETDKQNAGVFLTKNIHDDVSDMQYKRNIKKDAEESKKERLSRIKDNPNYVSPTPDGPKPSPEDKK